MWSVLGVGLVCRCGVYRCGVCVRCVLGVECVRCWGLKRVANVFFVERETRRDTKRERGRGREGERERGRARARSKYHNKG